MRTWLEAFGCGDAYEHLMHPIVVCAILPLERAPSLKATPRIAVNLRWVFLWSLVALPNRWRWRRRRIKRQHEQHGAFASRTRHLHVAALTAQVDFSE